MMERSGLFAAPGYVCEEKRKGSMIGVVLWRRRLWAAEGKGVRKGFVDGEAA
jgi:hypothetical protein